MLTETGAELILITILIYLVYRWTKEYIAIKRVKYAIDMYREKPQLKKGDIVTIREDIHHIIGVLTPAWHRVDDILALHKGVKFTVRDGGWYSLHIYIKGRSIIIDEYMVDVVGNVKSKKPKAKRGGKLL